MFLSAPASTRHFLKIPADLIHWPSQRLFPHLYQPCLMGTLSTTFLTMSDSPAGTARCRGVAPLCIWCVGGNWVLQGFFGGLGHVAPLIVFGVLRELKREVLQLEGIGGKPLQDAELMRKWGEQLCSFYEHHQLLVCHSHLRDIL